MNVKADNAATAVALRQVLGKLKRRLREKAPADPFSWSQLAVLRHLHSKGQASVSQLAKWEGVRSQSMGATLAAMEAEGWLARSPDPQDGRKVLFQMTPQCEAWLAQHRARRDDWLASIITSRFSPQEQDVLAQAMELLERIADAE